MPGFQSSLATNQAHQVTNPYLQQNTMANPQAAGQPPAPAATPPAAQGTNYQTGSNLDPSRPWEYSYMGANAPGLQHKGAPQQFGNVPGGNEGGGQMSGGPQGYGYYQFHAPGQNALNAQQHYLGEFEKGMPAMNKEMGDQLMMDSNKSMGKALHQQRVRDSNRGALHGGVHAAGEEGIRSNVAQGVASGKESINSGLLDEFHSMQSQTADNGMKMQQQQQQIQNQIYAQALKSFSANAGVAGELFGVAGMAGGMAISGGNPYAGMAGYQAGSTVGKAAY